MRKNRHIYCGHGGMEGFDPGEESDRDPVGDLFAVKPFQCG